jgi:hypothetical protein
MPAAPSAPAFESAAGTFAEQLVAAQTAQERPVPLTPIVVPPAAAYAQAAPADLDEDTVAPVAAPVSARRHAIAGQFIAEIELLSMPASDVAPAFAQLAPVQPPVAVAIPVAAPVPAPPAVMSSVMSSASGMVAEPAGTAIPNTSMIPVVAMTPVPRPAPMHAAAPAPTPAWVAAPVAAAPAPAPAPAPVAVAPAPEPQPEPAPVVRRTEPTRAPAPSPVLRDPSRVVTAWQPEPIASVKKAAKAEAAPKLRLGEPFDEKPAGPLAGSILSPDTWRRTVDAFRSIR